MQQSTYSTGRIARCIAATVTLVGAVAIMSVLLAQGVVAQAPMASLPPKVDTPTPTVCNPTWNVVPSQNVGPGDNILNDVAVVSANDVWAVGYYTGTGKYLTLTQHWDGTQWSIVPSPNPGANNLLRGVTAISANDVWAVGDYNVNSTRHLLTLHWDGTQWHNMPNPDPGGNYTNYLNGVDALSSNDVWTVGFYRRFAPLELIMRWNGAQWEVGNSPAPPVASLSGVDARAPDDVWAVGYTSSPSTNALIEHWDGSSWSVIPDPEFANPTYLDAVAAVAEDAAWAVGSEYVGGVYRTLIEHWDGIAWTVVSAPDVGGLSGIEAVAANDIWITGRDALLHWDGAAWATVPDLSGGRLGDLDALSADDIWGVGIRDEGGVTRTLVEHYAQSCSTATPIPSTPTHTPSPTQTHPPSSTPTFTPQATQTATPTAGSPTPPPSTATNTAVLTLTPTTCAINFSDVEPGSTFYSYVRCLACRGIAQGYSDGTYRPGDPVTRGQASKIIANAAMWSDAIPPDRQTFNDVPPNSTFWLHIERLYLHEAIAGYPCGGPGEPCPGTYFRPGNTLTRGQIAKVVSISAGFNDTIPPQQQTFNDVPPNSTFWLYIERAALHGVVNGYGDGTFRPHNTVTRGQIAKVTANAFFPACSTLSKGEN